MNFHSTKELLDHYKQVDKNLHAKAKKPWHPPQVTLCWWTPTVTELLPTNVGIPISLRRQVAQVMYEYDVTWEQLISDIKTKRFTDPRHFLWYTACYETKLSSCSLAKIFHRDHTTILSGVMAYCFKNKLKPPRGMSFKNAHYRGRFKNYRE